MIWTYHWNLQICKNTCHLAVKHKLCSDSSIFFCFTVWLSQQEGYFMHNKCSLIEKIIDNSVLFLGRLTSQVLYIHYPCTISA